MYSVNRRRHANKVNVMSSCDGFNGREKIFEAKVSRALLTQKKMHIAAPRMF